MNRILELLKKYREMVSYLFFGALTTLVNMVSYWLLAKVLPTVPATVLASVISILFAYVTNRRWVFESRTTGAAAWKEFGSFVGCRLSTLVLDAVVMWVGVDLLGTKLIGSEHAELWGIIVKLFSNVLVVIVNYVLSKLIVFAKKK